MSSKANKEIKNLTKDELASRERQIESELFQTKMQKVTGQLANTAAGWKLRKTLARVKTLQTQLAKGTK